MKWTKQQIEDHKKAAKLLIKIKNNVFSYIKKTRNVTEYEIQQFILEKFRKRGLKTDSWRPIVSFRENTSIVHYYASREKTKKLQPESLILVDLWARLNKKNAPFADITWMGYFGEKTPGEIAKVFNVVINSRDIVIDYIRASLNKNVIPTGREIDDIARAYLAKYGLAKYFLHGTGHPLGIANDHGAGVYINQKNKKRMSQVMGYTIEPGIYIENKFGVRSEIDFYIDENYKLVVTTEMQRKIIIL